MKRFLSVIIAIVFASCAYAQDTERETPAPKRVPGKNEIGLFAEIISGNSFGNATYNSYLGLQYKRWAKPDIAYRVMGALGDFNYNTVPQVIAKNGDTVISTQIYSNVPMYFVGGGVEVQRQFYKKVVLYAAIELRGGYGKAQYEKMEITEVNKDIPQTLQYTNNYRAMRPIASGGVSTFALDVTPFIGAKINFKRISLGTEATIVQAGLYTIKYATIPNYSYGNSEFSLGNFRQRVYVNFRF